MRGPLEARRSNTLRVGIALGMAYGMGSALGDGAPLWQLFVAAIICQLIAWPWRDDD